MASQGSPRLLIDALLAFAEYIIPHSCRLAALLCYPNQAPTPQLGIRAIIATCTLYPKITPLGESVIPYLFHYMLQLLNPLLYFSVLLLKNSLLRLQYSEYHLLLHMQHQVVSLQ
jgi:hypothetical protein